MQMVRYFRDYIWVCHKEGKGADDSEVKMRKAPIFSFRTLLMLNIMIPWY